MCVVSIYFMKQKTEKKNLKNSQYQQISTKKKQSSYMIKF